MKCSIPCERGILILAGIKELPAELMENIMQVGPFKEMLAIHTIVFAS